MWIFQDFFVLQILREINFGQSRNSKTVISPILRSLNFFKIAKIHKSQNSEPKCVQMVNFALQNYPKLISRKI